MRESLSRREQQTIAAELKSSEPLSIREIATRYQLTTFLAESLICRFEIPYRATPSDNSLFKPRIREEWERHQIARNVAAAKAELARQITLARAEATRTKLYRKGPLQW